MRSLRRVSWSRAVRCGYAREGRPGRARLVALLCYIVDYDYSVNV